MTTTMTMSYAAWVTELSEIAARANIEVREASFDAGGLSRRVKRKLLRRAVYRLAIRSSWFATLDNIQIALTYCDRYAVEDDQARMYLRPGKEHCAGEWERALLSACIYHHVVHSLT